MTLRYVVEYERFLLGMLNILNRKLLLKFKKKGKKKRNGLGDASLCLQKSKTPNKTWFASNVILWIHHNINYWN
jgi:hypothetical protein